MSYKNIKFSENLIGKNQPIFIIAEIGATHNGDLDQALLLIEAAKKSGAQAVKLGQQNPK